MPAACPWRDANDVHAAMLCVRSVLVAELVRTLSTHTASCNGAIVAPASIYGFSHNAAAFPLIDQYQLTPTRSATCAVYEPDLIDVTTPKLGFCKGGFTYPSLQLSLFHYFTALTAFSTRLSSMTAWTEFHFIRLTEFSQYVWSCTLQPPTVKTTALKFGGSSEPSVHSTWSPPTVKTEKKQFNYNPESNGFAMQEKISQTTTVCAPACPMSSSLSAESSRDHQSLGQHVLVLPASSISWDLLLLPPI